eukprot:CAMPEP_0114121692 /NCGR_PEP_ID=MMETSP0043_2-20121206/7308_1 /TAXON_ID=464988 /ORGANISM="Hemiselmis andersenii, Strain CCMP644" /LENGTH=30 /DNA_ID= /DNA_START= /DNA_END= /DNA_ORIENTATION=
MRLPDFEVEAVIAYADDVIAASLNFLSDLL